MANPTMEVAPLPHTHAQGMELKKILGTSDLSREGAGPLVAALAAEFVATLFIVFFGCGAAVNFLTPTDIVQIRQMSPMSPYFS